MKRYQGFIIPVALLTALSTSTAVADASDGETEPIGVEGFGGSAGWEGIISGILNVSDVERSWAKPIETVDLDFFRHLFETGFLTDHEADWYVVIDSNSLGEDSR